MRTGSPSGCKVAAYAASGTAKVPEKAPERCLEKECGKAAFANGQLENPSRSGILAGQRHHPILRGHDERVHVLRAAADQSQLRRREGGAHSTTYTAGDILTGDGMSHNATFTSY
ncbi:MAG: hypothetical protein HC933_18745, partial [Pleurocapsa sp. SU_196_0]|nr:hypothetical protein [Pleurocapsa sp. SU_196_0]